MAASCWEETEGERWHAQAVGFFLEGCYDIIVIISALFCVLSLSNLAPLSFCLTAFRVINNEHLSLTPNWEQNLPGGTAVHQTWLRT